MFGWSPLRLALSACAIISTLLLGSPSVQAADAEYTLNFGTVAPENTPWSDQLKDIKKRIEAESKGRIKVRIFMSGVMGGEVEMIRDIVEGGRLQGGGFTTAAVATGANVAALQLPELPFLFRNDAEADHVLDTVLFKPMQKKLRRRGIFLAMWSQNGWRSFFTKNKPGNTIANLAEHKMRVQESDVHKAMYKALGVQAFPIPVPEVLDALSRGTVDGFDNTSLFSQASGWFEPMKYYTLSKHIFQPAAIVYSRDWLESLPEDLQTVVIGDRLSEQKLGRKLVRDMETELLANFKELGVDVVQISEAELTPMIQATKTVHDQFRDVVGSDLLDAVYKALEDFRK